MQSHKFARILLASTLFPSLVRSTISLAVQGDAFLDVYKPVSWARAPTDPETFLLVNVALDTAATQGIQQLLETKGVTSGIIQFVAQSPGDHHVLAFLDATSVTEDVPIAASNTFRVGPALTSPTTQNTKGAGVATLSAPGLTSTVPSTVVAGDSSATTLGYTIHLNTSAIMGGIVGAFVVIMLVLVGLWFVLRRRGAAIMEEGTMLGASVLDLLPPSPSTSYHTRYQRQLFPCEKSPARYATPSLGPYAVFIISRSHASPVPSLYEQPQTTSDSGSATGTLKVRVRTLPPLPVGDPPSTSRGTDPDETAARLNEAVVEIAALRGELQSLHIQSFQDHQATYPPPAVSV